MAAIVGITNYRDQKDKKISKKQEQLAQQQQQEEEDSGDLGDGSSVPYDEDQPDSELVWDSDDDSLEFPPEVSKKIIASLSWQRKVHAIFDASGVEEEHYVDQHRILRGVLLSISFSLIIVSVVVFTIESQPTYYRKKLVTFFILEAICITWFTAELILRAVTCPSVKEFCKSPMNWIDFLSVFPFYLDMVLLLVNDSGSEDASGLVLIRVVRLTRAFRVFKLSKYNEGLQIVVSAVHRSTDALSLLAFLTTIATVLFGSAMFYAEQSAAEFDPDLREWVRLEEYGGPSKPHPFKSIPHSFWWCFVTVTTVGYGDMYPVTTFGYLVATCAMLSGLLLIAFPIIILGLNFSDARDLFIQEKSREQNALRLRKQHLTQKLTEQLASDELNGKEIGDVIKEVANEVLMPDAPPRETVASLLAVLTQKVEILEEKMAKRFGPAPSPRATSPRGRKQLANCFNAVRQAKPTTKEEDAKKPRFNNPLTKLSREDIKEAKEKEMAKDERKPADNPKVQGDNSDGTNAKGEE